MAFSYAVNQQGAKSVVSLVGDADMSQVDVMKAILDKALAVSPHIIVDCSKTTMINSTCFGVINSYRSKAEKAGGKIIFAAIANERVQKVFDVMGWSKISKVYKTVDEAVKA